jgi:Zn-dependent M28 family amino/carboxypeptidase
MRIERLWGVLASAALLLAGCSTQPKEVPSTDIDDVAYQNHVRVLASDDFQGRKPGTPGEDKTVAYISEQFRKLGLKPGNGKSYVQQVPLTQISGSEQTLSMATGAGSHKLVYGKDMVIWSTLAQPQIELKGSEVIFVGFGIVAPEYAWNDYADLDVRGKTVVVLANDPGYASKDPTAFKANGMTDYGRWAYKIEEAGRQGAAGVLLVHDQQATGCAWEAVQSLWGSVQFTPPAAGASTGPAIEGWLQNAAARALFAQAGIDFDRTAVAAAIPGFKAVPLGLKADASMRNTVRSFTSANVIGLLPGRKGHEYVVYTAHWDSLGTDPSIAGHNIYNGAIDNATGVSGLLVLAQSFARTKPVTDRSIVFLATTAAEPRLLGSQYYVENPVFPLRQTAAVFNLDTLLIGGRSRDVSIVGFGNTDLEDMARTQALLEGREIRAEPYPHLGLYRRSDSYSFARRGIPVLYLQLGIDSGARGPAWGRAQLDDYYAHRYAQTSDVYSADWDVYGAMIDLTLAYRVGEQVAGSRRFPRWYPGSEYRVAHPHPRVPPSD